MMGQWAEVKVTALMMLAFIFPVHPLTAGTQPLQYVEQTLEIKGEKHKALVPQGYTLEVLTTDLMGPRMLAFGPNGDLFIGSKSRNIFRLAPPYDKPEVLISIGAYPHSVAFRDNEMFIARANGLFRADYRPGQKTLKEKDIVQVAPLPHSGGHSSRTVAVGPDGRVYISIGISDNCNDQYLDDTYPFEDRRGGILVLIEDEEKPRLQPFATGLRNPVGFDWHPQTREMYASNNGPDHSGFEQPPEYFSRLTAGSFHGMPWFQFDGKAIKRDDCIEKSPPRPLKDVPAPVATFPARNAPMGVAFVPGNTMDEKLVGDAVVALRGSWATWPAGGHVGLPSSRREPKLVIVRFENGEAKRVDDLVTGFQSSFTGSRWARPVGVAIGPDGALYFTSDSGTEGLFRLRPNRP